MPRRVVADAASHRQPLLLQINVLPGQAASLANAKSGVVRDLDRQKGGVFLFEQHLIQFKKLFVGDRRDNWNILIRSVLRKQVIILRPLAVHDVLHGVEGEIPLREYRETERTLQHGGVLPHGAAAQRFPHRAVRPFTAKAQQVQIALQMIRCDLLQLTVGDGVLLDASGCVDVGGHRAVAQRTGLQFLLNPLVQQPCKGQIFGFCYELLFLIIRHGLAEHGFRFALALRTGKLPLDAVAAGILYIEPIVPLLSLFSYRTFCHSASPLIAANGAVMMCCLLL